MNKKKYSSQVTATSKKRFAEAPLRANLGENEIKTPAAATALVISISRR